MTSWQADLSFLRTDNSYWWVKAGDITVTCVFSGWRRHHTPSQRSDTQLTSLNHSGQIWHLKCKKGSWDSPCVHSNTGERWGNTFLQEQVVTILSSSCFLSAGGKAEKAFSRKQRRQNPAVWLDVFLFIYFVFILARETRLPVQLRTAPSSSLCLRQQLRRMLPGAGCVSSPVATGCHSDGPELIGRWRWWWRRGDTYGGTERRRICLHGSLLQILSAVYRFLSSCIQFLNILHKHKSSICSQCTIIGSLLIL